MPGKQHTRLTCLILLRNHALFFMKPALLEVTREVKEPLLPGKAISLYRHRGTKRYSHVKNVRQYAVDLIGERVVFWKRLHLVCFIGCSSLQHICACKYAKITACNRPDSTGQNRPVLVPRPICTHEYKHSWCCTEPTCYHSLSSTIFLKMTNNKQRAQNNIEAI